MTPFGIGRPLPEPSETPLTDRIVAGLAAVPSAEVEVDVDISASPYWTTSLTRPTGFVPVDLGGPTPENVAHGLLLALAAVPVGVALAFTTGRAGPVTVLAAAALALGATVLYRLGARSIGRRGVGTVCSVVLLGALLEVVAIAASEAPVSTRGGAVGPGGYLVALVHRLGDPTQASRYVGATAILLFVALSVTAGALVWLSGDGETDSKDGLHGVTSVTGVTGVTGEQPTAGAVEEPPNTSHDHARPDELSDDDTGDHPPDEKAEADATDD